MSHGLRDVYSLSQKPPLTHFATATMDSSPTSLFDSYEQDFQQILQSIREKLEGDGSEQRGGAYMPTQHTFFYLNSPLTEQKKAALRRVEMELDEADEMVRGILQCSPHRLHLIKKTTTLDLTNGD